jgi:ketosteroid isomerase-like protein
MERLNAQDLDGIAACLADDVTAFVPSAQPDRVNGKAALVEIFRNYVDPSLGPTHLTPEDQEVVVNGKMALVTFNIRNPHVVSRRSFLYRWDAGSWKIIHFHASNIRLDAP